MTVSLGLQLSFAKLPPNAPTWLPKRLLLNLAPVCTKTKHFGRYRQTCERWIRSHQGPNRITVPIFWVLLLQILQLPVQEATLPGVHEQPAVPLFGVVQIHDIVSILGFLRLLLASNSCTSWSCQCLRSRVTGNRSTTHRWWSPNLLRSTSIFIAKTYYKKSTT